MELNGIGILKTLENLGFFWFQFESTWNWVKLDGIKWNWVELGFWRFWKILDFFDFSLNPPGIGRNWMELNWIGWNWDFEDFGKSWIFLISAWIHLELREIGLNWGFEDFSENFDFFDSAWIHVKLDEIGWK